MGDMVGDGRRRSRRGIVVCSAAIASALALGTSSARAHPHPSDTSEPAPAVARNWNDSWRLAGALSYSAGAAPGPGADLGVWAPNGLGLGIRGDLLAVSAPHHYSLLQAGFSQRLEVPWLSFSYLVGPVYGNYSNVWVSPRHCSYPLAIAPPTDCSPPDDWEHIDRDFWGGGVSGALDLLVGPVFAGIQGGAHLPLAGHDIVPVPFVGLRIGARFRLWTPDEPHANRERTATRSP
jgi:hypothetical protein